MGGHGSQILPMAFFVVIVTFFLVSFYSSRILTAGCFTLNDRRGVHNLDEKENGEEAPAPSPRRAVHRHSHHHRPSLPQAHKAKQKKKKEEGEGSSRRVLTAVLVSAGVTFSLCAVCLFWGCRRFQNKKKKTELVWKLLAQAHFSQRLKPHSQPKSSHQMGDKKQTHKQRWKSTAKAETTALGQSKSCTESFNRMGPAEAKLIRSLMSVFQFNLQFYTLIIMIWSRFDEEMIESLFGYNLQNSMNDEAKSKTPSPTKHVLEPKRLQNITILSKALNVSANQVCEALTKGKGLSLRELEALAKMVPNKEEEAKLANYKGDINELGSAEKFVKAILKVPFAFQRVEAMLYQETFSDEEACKELRSSRLFLKLLEAVLKTGNRMNVGTVRGGARAFKLDALLKLADVKGTDGKTTLLHFVVQEIVRSEGLKFSESIMGKIEQRTKPKNPENDREENYRRMGLDLVSGLSTELCNVKKTATIDLDVLASSVSNLSAGIANIRSLVAMEDRIVDGFVGSMRSFLNGAERALKELREDENGVLLRVREITEYFHGDVSKDEPNPLRIFVIVRDFLGMLDHVCKQLRNSKPLSSPSPLSPFR
nr:formin-like protein 11 [Ipomoea batatas]